MVFLSARPDQGRPRTARICAAFYSNDERSVWVDGIRYVRIARLADANFRAVATKRACWIASPRFVGLHAPFLYQPPEVDAGVALEFEQFMAGEHRSRETRSYNRR